MRRLPSGCLAALAACLISLPVQPAESDPDMAAAAAAAEAAPLRPANAFPEGALIGRPLTPPNSNESAQASELRLALLNSYGLVRQSVVKDYLNGLLQDILAVAGMQDVHCRLEVLSDLSLIAEARPSGLITVSFGWLMQAEDEAELVALLAHELGHVLLGHHDSDAVAGLPTLVHQLLSATSALSSKLAPTAMMGRNLSYGSMLSNDVFHPTWKRGQERDADKFAIDVVAKLGYSVARGPKAMLERIAPLDSAAEKADNADPAGAGKFSAALSGWVKSLSRSHDDAASRADLAVEYFETVWSESPLRGRRKASGRLAEIRRTGEFARVFDAHQRAARIRELAAAGNVQVALEQARYPKGEKPGSLLNHMALCDVWLEAKRSKEARECLAEGMGLSKDSWLPARALSNHLKESRDGPGAIQVAERGFDALGRPPVLLPEIAFLVRDLNKEVAQKYVRECAGAGSALLQACVNNANHEERIQRSQAEGARIADRITNKLFKK